MNSSPYDQLLNYVKQTNALAQVSGLLSWDQEVMMPPKGAQARSEQAAIVEAIAHERRSNIFIEQQLAEIDTKTLDETQQANIRLIRRSYERSVRVPARLAEELARQTAIAQGVWAKARAANRFDDFAPTLQRIIELKREEAACLQRNGLTKYDALLNDFEPGMTVSRLQPLLESLRPRLSTLRQKISESTVKQKGLNGTFDRDTQMVLARKLADVVGYDWQAGRLDLSVHPFSSGTAGDSRITTRIDEQDPLGCLYSTIHELGHALYEQGLANCDALTPVAHHVSMGVHESQSRLWENQIARSLPFCEWFYPSFKAAFPNSGIGSANDLYRAVNQVQTGFIRTESDEVHYNLHVLLRFELERELIAGELDVKDLEAEWNRRFKRDFGLEVPGAAQGVLQDVHWSVGLFGYFPTYSLGNIYAGQINETLRRDLPDMDAGISMGENTDILKWLRQKIHHNGSLYEPHELMERTVGQPISTEPLLTYLETKYAELFDLQ